MDELTGGPKRKILLTFEERKRIEQCLRDGHSLHKTSRILGRSVSIIYRETMRCGGKERYSAEKAQEISDTILRARIEKSRKSYSDDGKKFIIEAIKNRRSPASIAYEMKTNLSTLKRWLTRENISWADCIGHAGNFDERLANVEMQIDIIFEQLEKLNVRN